MPSGQMSRSTQFRADRVPLRHNKSLRLIDSKVGGPVAFLNPTQAHFRPEANISPARDHRRSIEASDRGEPTSSPTTEFSQPPIANIEYKWTSRDNRKGRHTVLVKSPSVEHPESNVSTPRSTTHWRSIVHTIWLMITSYPVWDVSWCVAFIFTIGSVLWVINSFFVFLPLIQPSSSFHNEVLVGGGVTAFIGATIFEIGSILLMLEAVNENREGCFGWAVEKAYEEHIGLTEAGQRTGSKVVPKDQACTHHHRNKKNLVGNSQNTTPSPALLVGSDKEKPNETKSWTWCPSWVELKNHYFHELGFIASLSQLLGATVFWISGFTALPGIINVLSPGLLDGIYWTPQVVGGSGFIISGTLFMVETQKHWWLPAPTVLGWHIGFWNLIGGIG